MVISDKERALYISYHDEVCPDGVNCRSDISVYPTPPDDYRPTVNIYDPGMFDEED